MAEFTADGLASDGTLRALREAERPRNRTAGNRRLPSSQLLIPNLRIQMAKAMHLAQPSRVALAVVGIALLDERFVCRNQGSGTDEPMDAVEDEALLAGSNRHRAGASTLGPRAFQDNAVASVRVTRSEQETFFSAQTECLLQPQTHADVRIGDSRQSVVYLLRIVVVGDKLAVRDPECCIVRGNCPRIADLLRPPAQNRHAIFDRTGL